MNYKSIIPNALTSLNLIFGVMSIFASFEQDFVAAGVYIVLAMIADAMDGRAARYFDVSGEFGKELDSLCDLGSFGVAAGVLIYQFALIEFGIIGKIAAMLFATAMAFRLARFNVMVSSVSGYFMGLPAPGGGCILATFAVANLPVDPVIVLVGVFVYAYITVSGIKYPDFKGKGNPVRTPSTIISALILAYLVYIIPAGGLVRSIPFLIFFSYSLVGVVNHFYCMLSSKN